MTDTNKFHEIISGLYIGRSLDVISPEGRKQIKEMNITRVLTCSSEPINQNHRVEGVDYKFVNIYDTIYQDILSNAKLHDSLRYIEAAARDRANIIVHCEQGVSRSPTIVVAYLMRRFKWNAEETLGFVASIYPSSCPNPSFYQQLRVFWRNDCISDPNLLWVSPSYRNHCANFGKLPISLGLYGYDTYNKKQGYFCGHDLNKSADIAKICYKCRICQVELFHDLHILRHTRGEYIRNRYSHIPEQGIYVGHGNSHDFDENLECPFEYLITPMKWMNLSQYQGKIYCPLCNAKIGQYAWDNRTCMAAQCGASVTPWIHIQKAKVDARFVKKEAANANNQDEQSNLGVTLGNLALESDDSMDEGELDESIPTSATNAPNHTVIV